MVFSDKSVSGSFWINPVSGRGATKPKTVWIEVVSKIYAKVVWTFDGRVCPHSNIIICNLYF